MKKIIFLICSFALVFGLSIPSFAEETDYNSFTKIVFNQKLSSAYDIYGSYDFNFYDSDGTEFYGMRFYGTKYVYNLEFKYYTDSNEYGRVYDFSSNRWHNEASSYILEDYTIYVEDIYSIPSVLRDWIVANSDLEVKCDGSVCPATDLNFDNVCDDCGMTFAVPRNYAPSDWNTAFPVPPSTYDSYTVLTVDGTTYLYMVDGEVPTLNISDPDAEGKRTLYFIMVGSHPQVSIQRYQLINGEWAYDSVNSIRSFKFNDTLKIEYSTVPVLDSSGQPFFPRPLWAEVGEMTAEEIPALRQIVVGVLLTLTVCGVGCLILLMVFPLLRKVFSIFRV